MSLPARLGGLSIRDCVADASREYECSVLLCSPIIDELVLKKYGYDYDCEIKQRKVKTDSMRERKLREEELLRFSESGGAKQVEIGW